MGSRRSDPAALRRADAIVRNGRDVANGHDLQPAGLKRPESRLAAGARPRNLDLDRPHAMLHGGAPRLVGRHLRGIGSGLARPLETELPRRRPGDRVALNVGDGDHRVVERGMNMHHTRGDVLALLAARADGFLGHLTVLSAVTLTLLLLAGDRLGRTL